MRRLAAVVGAVIALALLAASAFGATITAHIGSFYFEDATVGDGEIDVHVGDQVKFIVDDGGAGGKPHSVVVTELGIDSGGLLAGSTYVTPVLDTPGTYILFCRFHRVSQDHWTTLVVTGTKATPKPTPAPTVVTPSPPPGSLPAPAASPSGGATPSPRASGGASGPPAASPGATAATPAPSGIDANGSGDPGLAATPGASGGGPAASAPGPGTSDAPPLPSGVTGPTSLTWLRSVVVGALVLPALVAVAAIAFLAAKKRARPGP